MAALLLCQAVSFGQNSKTDVEAQKMLGNLSFIKGKWAGSGWMMTQNGKKEAFTQTEDISYQLDGTLLLILGHGKAEGETIHNALALVSYNKEKQQLVFRSYLANGTQGEYLAEFKKNSLWWYPNENMRYIITLNDKGQWQEIGEMNRSGSWNRFFEMTLDKMN